MTSKFLLLSSYLLSTLDPRPNPQGRVWGITLLGSVLLECHSLSNSANFLFQIFNAIGQVLLQFSKFLCSIVYSLPVISLTRTLVGWSDVRFLINTDGSISVLKTLPSKVFLQTLPCGLGLGSRLVCVCVCVWFIYTRPCNHSLCLQHVNFGTSGISDIIVELQHETSQYRTLSYSIKTRP